MAGNSEDNKALVPVQGREIGTQNGVVDPNNLPILKAQENCGIFERATDDGKTRETMLQRQQMELRGTDTQNQSIRVMEGRDKKFVVQENEEGVRIATIQQQSRRINERTATSETQQDLSLKATTAAVNMKDGTKGFEVSVEKTKLLQHKTEENMLLHAAGEKGRMARQYREGQQEDILDKDEIELHAQISFDGSKQYSGKFRNVQLLSKQTAEGTQIQMRETKAFLGMDEQGELALTDGEVYTMEFTLNNYLHSPSSFIDKSDVKKGFGGFMDILYRQKKLPWSLGLKILYKFGLLVFFLTGFIYPVILFSIEQEHAAYNVVCGLISLIGLCIELYDLIPDLYHYIKQWNEKRRQLREDQQAVVEADDKVLDDNHTKKEDNHKKKEGKSEKSNKEDQETNVSYTEKTKYVFKEFVLQSLGEILIYPSVICSLYGFVNEKGWQFNNAVAVFDFLFLLYSIIMDVFYAKLYYIRLVQKIIKTSYKAHDEYEQIISMDWKRRLDRYLTPFYLTIPFSVTVILSHWMILGIIGVRIYADNFVREKDGSQGFPPEPETGDYQSRPYTRYMIFCGMYLPLASTIVYIILNKYWFLQIYWLIKNHGNNTVVTEKQQQRFYKYQCIKFIPQSVKIMAFLRDPWAYIAVIFLMVPFIPFMVGTFLSDYNDSDLKITDGTRSAAVGLGVIFLLLFLASNAQAAIIFVVLVILLTITILYILWVATHPKQMAKGMAKKAYREFRNNGR